VEDALPEWLLARYPQRGGATFAYFEGTGGTPTVERRERHHSLRVRVGSVCTKCNNEWMSALQKEARPVLERMLDGKDTPLSHHAQRILAAWAMMTCVTLQERNEKAAIPAEHAHALYPGTHNGTRRSPSMQVIIAAAHYAGSLTGLSFLVLAPKAQAGSLQMSAGSVHSSEFRINFHYWVVLRIGPVVFLVFGHLLPNWWREHVDVNLDPPHGRVRIWHLSPPTATWPPALPLDDELFERAIGSIASLTWPPQESTLIPPTGGLVWKRERGIWRPTEP
jgi:hypothetical protein